MQLRCPIPQNIQPSMSKYNTMESQKIDRLYSYINNESIRSFSLIDFLNVSGLHFYLRFTAIHYYLFQNISNKKLLLCTLEREKFVKCFCPFFDDATTTSQCFWKVRSKNANYSLHIT